MDIEEFDRLYPSPAHAAAADLSDRYAPKPKRFQRDRSGAVAVIASLVASLLAGSVYALKANEGRAANYSIQTDIPERPSKVVAQQTARTSPATKPIARLGAASAPSVTAFHHSRPAATTYKPIRHRGGASKWIADPLSGDALAAALIVDKRRTVELNAEQLKLMADDGAKQAAFVLPVTVASGSGSQRN
jgi:hypothetical protein